jgi:hypothetical protein
MAESIGSQLGRARLFDYLHGAKRVLLAGAGGGCDIYCGIPLYFALQAQGHEVHLANLSFTYLHTTDATKHGAALYEVTADTQGSPGYFPEVSLCRWFAKLGESVRVFAFERTGVDPIAKAYKRLAKMLEIDAIVLVDGGTDSLMRGDEFHLGTPQEDVASIIAASETSVARKALVCAAFGVDAFHGICHAQFLENAAHLTKAGHSLGVFSADPSLPEVRHYLDAVEYLNSDMPRVPSIVNTSMCSAIRGDYGDVHTNHRTAGSKLWINPLMALYWGFELDPVADRLLYREHVRKTQTYPDLSAAIGMFRESLAARREFEQIPV